MQILLFFLASFVFNVFGQNCPNLNNNNNNPNFSATVYVFDENFQLIDSVGCSVAGNSGNFNCEEIDENHNYVYINGDDACFYDSDGVSIDHPLPIELVSFKGYNQESSNFIKWITASERNNHYFKLEHSSDGYNWTQITIVQGAGNSSHNLSYSYRDYNFSEGKINYFRLSQTDYDGTTEVFDPISVDNIKNQRLLVETYNLLGQLVDENFKGIVIQVFDGGSTIKMRQ